MHKNMRQLLCKVMCQRVGKLMCEYVNMLAPKVYVCITLIVPCQHRCFVHGAMSIATTYLRSMQM